MGRASRSSAGGPFMRKVLPLPDSRPVTPNTLAPLLLRLSGIVLLAVGSIALGALVLPSLRRPAAIVEEAPDPPPSQQERAAELRQHATESPPVVEKVEPVARTRALQEPA